MLKDKVKTVIKAVGGTYVRVSEYSGMAAANIGKITNGSRIPARKSSTAYKLSAGIYRFSEATGKLDILCATIGCETAAGEKKIRKALLDWLYEDVVELDDRTEGFAKRINEIMSVAGVGIPEICTATGSGRTLLAAYCDGSKIPTRRSKYLIGVCESIYSHAKEGNVIDAVAEMLEVPTSALTDNNAALIIREWLLGRNENADIKATASLIKQITSPPALPSNLPEPGEVATDEILNENQILYTGINGLQRAVIRFLGNAAGKPGSELLLYSDQSMEWMQARYTIKWMTLMKECLHNGVKMKIIHNIDRDPSEMLFALQNWLPLYMTGLIEPYYRSDTSGSRFSHTVFISEDECIDGFCTVGAERNCLYHYITDSEYVADVRQSYEKLLFGIKPLLRFERGVFKPQKHYTVYECGDVRLYLSSDDAVVSKFTEPQCSFILKHPYLIRMFNIYAQHFGRETGS